MQYGSEKLDYRAERGTTYYQISICVEETTEVQFEKNLTVNEREI
jgi:hypothetical protein